MNVFNQALQDDSTCDLDTPNTMARLLLGVKIERNNASGDVTIKDCSRSSFYREVDSVAQDIFDTQGWRAGVLAVFNERYDRRLSRLTASILAESTTKNRQRVVGALERDVERLTDRKDELLQKYNY